MSLSRVSVGINQRSRPELYEMVEIEGGGNSRSSMEGNGCGLNLMARARKL